MKNISQLLSAILTLIRCSNQDPEKLDSQSLLSIKSKLIKAVPLQHVTDVFLCQYLKLSRAESEINLLSFKLVHFDVILKKLTPSKKVSLTQPNFE